MWKKCYSRLLFFHIHIDRSNVKGIGGEMMVMQIIINIICGIIANYIFAAIDKNE